MFIVHCTVCIFFLQSSTIHESRNILQSWQWGDPLNSNEFHNFIGRTRSNFFHSTDMISCSICLSKVPPSSIGSINFSRYHSTAISWIIEIPGVISSFNHQTLCYPNSIKAKGRSCIILANTKKDNKLDPFATRVWRAGKYYLLFFITKVLDNRVTFPTCLSLRYMGPDSPPILSVYLWHPKLVQR